MKRSLMTMCLASLVAGAMALPLSAGDKEPVKPVTGGQPAGTPQMSPEMAKAMARMAEYGAVNENHAYLKQFEGEWNCASKWWMPDGSPPIENKFTSSAKVSFDGRFLIEKVQGNVTMVEGMPPQPFTGMSIIGYDNHKKQFSSTWLDNWMTGTMTEFGSASEGGKVFTFEGDNYCCMNDKVCHSKSVTTIVDANTRKMEMWAPGLDGKVYKGCEMTFTRKK